MSIQRQILEAVITLINGLSEYATLIVGPLPDANGLSIATSTGSETESTLAHGGYYTLNLVLNGKHHSQATVIDALCSIHEYLNHLLTYPTGTNWAVTAIRTTSSPGYVDREGDGSDLQWLYGSSIEINYVID